MASNNEHASSSSSSSSTGKVSSKSRIQSFKMMHKLVATYCFITIIQDAFVNKRDSSAVVDRLLRHQIDIQLRRKMIMKMQREEEEDHDDDDDVEEPESLSSSTAFDRVFNFQKKRTKMLLKDLQDDNVRNYDTLYLTALAGFLFCFRQTRDDDDDDNDEDDDDDVEKPESSSSTVPNESSNLFDQHAQKDMQESRNDQDPSQCVENLAESSTVRDHDSTNNNDLQQVENKDSQDHNENSAESSNILHEDDQDDLQEARNDEHSTQAVVDMQQGGNQDQQTQADDNNKDLWPTLCDAEKKLKNEREMGIRNKKNKKKWNYRDDKC